MNNKIVGTNKSVIAEGANVSKELFNDWLAFIDASQKTKETYTRAIRQFAYYLQEQGINQPTYETMIAYKQYLKDAGKKPTTINAYLMACKQFFKWCEEKGIYKDIAKNVKGVKIDKEFKKDALTKEQAQDLLKSIDTNTTKGKRDLAIILLMLTTGLRTIEVQRANIEDLRNVADFTALFIQGKGREERNQYVKITNQVLKVINEYLATRSEAKGQEPLFCSNSNHNANGRMTTRSISRIVKNSLINTGYKSERLTAHSLRHTTATLNLLNGGTLEETKQLLRHSNLNTTLIYSHALDRAKSQSEARITGVLLNAM